MSIPGGGKDTKGDKKGVPYDGNLTLADGKGKWWEGLDPKYLYGINLREYETVAEAATQDGLLLRLVSLATIWSMPNGMPNGGR